MNSNFLKKIDNVKHVMIVADAAYLSGASALYTYLLTKHKKVTLVCQTKSLDKNLSFLPWFDKIKDSQVSSADYILEFNSGCIELFELFKNNTLKINQKMATALYSGLLVETDGFMNRRTNGTIFAMAKELIEVGAEYKICNEFIMKRTSLSALRLKAIMLKNMILQNSAKAAVFCICDDDFMSSGARLEDCDEILIESLTLPNVEQAILLNIDEEYEILKIINKEI